jgi:dihydropteroate synthase
VIPVAGSPRVLALHDVDEARRLLTRMHVSAAGVDIMDKKALFRVVRISGLDPRAASILKQEMLSRGGEVATSREVYESAGRQAECLMMGTLSQYERLLPKLRAQPFGLRFLADSIASALHNRDSRSPSCHPVLDLSERPRIMGIVNVTPDSFSDGGDAFQHDSGVALGEKMLEEGAHIVDVGGESTRPGAEPLPLEEELRRVVPVIQTLAAKSAAPISVDTYKAVVAARALEAGAVMVNDISALRMDPEMVAVVRDAECPVVLLHMLGEPRNMQQNPTYDDVVQEVYAFFVERLSWAVDQGLKEENLLIDPGIGFGKNLDHNVAILRNLGTFRSLGRPLVLGASRKAWLGRILDRPEPKERVVGTVAATVIGAMQDVDIVRVHDVLPNAEALRVVRAVFPDRER